MIHDGHRMQICHKWGWREGNPETDVDAHPVCILFADKIAHLTGTQAEAYGGLVVSKAYEACRNKAE